MDGTEAAGSGMPSMFIFGLSASVGSCIFLLLVLYNLVALIGVMRSDDEVGASGLAKAAWGVGFLSVIFITCSPLLSLIAVVLSRVEIGRVYRDESPLASATPARMGSVNAGVAFVIWLILAMGAVLNLVTSSS